MRLQDRENGLTRNNLWKNERLGVLFSFKKKILASWESLTGHLTISPASSWNKIDLKSRAWKFPADSSQFHRYFRQTNLRHFQRTTLSTMDIKPQNVQIFAVKPFTSFIWSTYTMVYYGRHFYSIRMSSMEVCGWFDSVEYEQDFYFSFHLINWLGGAINSSKRPGVFSGQMLKERGTVILVCYGYYGWST